MHIGKTIFRCLNIILIIQNWYYYHFVLLLQIFYKNQRQIDTFELPWSVQITCTPLTLISNYALLCVVDLIMQACIACNAYGKNIKSIIICCMTSLVMQDFALCILMRKIVVFMWRKPRLHSK